MEWINDYGFAVFLVLIAAMFFFGYRIKGKNANIHEEHKHGSDVGDKGHKSGHGCCH